MLRNGLCSCMSLILAYFVCALVLGVAAQHPCSAPPSWIGSYQLFTNLPNHVPVTEGIARYNSQLGLRFDGILGQERFAFYNLPTAFYLVNMTVRTSPTCRRFACQESCFKPITVGGTNWHFNATVIVGLSKVEKWSVFSTRTVGRETIVIVQPTSSSGFKQCIPITNNNVRGEEEDDLRFTFGLWFNITATPIDPSEFTPPSICPSSFRDVREQAPQTVALVEHFSDNNRLYR